MSLKYTHLEREDHNYHNQPRRIINVKRPKRRPVDDSEYVTINGVEYEVTDY